MFLKYVHMYGSVSYKLDITHSFQDAYGFYKLRARLNRETTGQYYQLNTGSDLWFFPKNPG